MSPPALIVAAPASGQGKTVVTLGLLRALRRRGLAVAAFKVGPDYIDPAFHAHACGRPAVNLDPWAMRLETLVGLLDHVGSGADLVIGEGVMGLFDGAADGTGSTADLAALLGLPVVLTVDASGMGASVAALVDGFRCHRDDVALDGVVLGRTGGQAHAELLRRALREHLPTPVLGHLPRDPALALPSRHLGLVQASEHPDLDAVLDRAAALVTAAFDLDRLERLARRPALSVLGADVRPLPPPGQRIAVASDVAFAFAYAATLEGWRRQGAEIVPFSPLRDEGPDPAATTVYLPGGYPELHAGRLAAAGRFLAGLRAAAARGSFVYGECGGYMVMGTALIDAAGMAHGMAGLLPVVTSFATPRLQLGYRRIETLAASPLGPPGARFRGHEFHCAREVERAGEPLFAARTADGRGLSQQGSRVGSAAGSFLHLIDRAGVGGRPLPGLMREAGAAA